MERPKHLATLGDVAALAGVSRSTVSNVVRGADVVAPRTRRRIEKVIEQLGYRPNALARHLLRGHANTIGIIARDLRNPFFAEMASLAEREVARFGFAAMFTVTEGDPDREEQAIRVMLEHRISGLIFLSFLSRPGSVKETISGRVPAVFMAAVEPWADSITVDEHLGGELVARHLIELGHERLAFVGPQQRDSADTRRLEGFLHAAADAGLRPTVIAWDPPDGSPTVGSVTSAWPALLSPRDGPTGVFAANDFAAIDLLDVADALGIAVPAQLSVAGFDDVEMAGLGRINLTTVNQPRDVIVRMGVETLLGRIDGRIDGEPQVVFAGVSLRIRGSTGLAARGGGEGLAIGTLQPGDGAPIVTVGRGHGASGRAHR